MGKLICDRCIRGIRSKGETIMVGSIADNTDDVVNECHWCGGTEIELYEFTVPLLHEPKPGSKKERISLYEKNRRAVYATGNKWAIENWNATH